MKTTCACFRICTGFVLATIIAGAGCKNVDKSTGITMWGDLGINIGPGGGDGGPAGPDMAMYQPAFPYTLTPLTNANTATANISLYFSVTDANNRGVPGLSCGGGGDMGQPSCSKFWIDQEDGVPVDPNESHLQVEALSGNNLDIPTVLVLDLSGNIIANGNLPNLQAAADTIIDAMLPEQRMAIIAFADQPVLEQSFTKDKTVLKAAISNLANANIGVSSALFKTMVQALGMWQDGFDASDPAMTKLTAGMVIVVASGEDMAGGATYNDVIQARGNKRVIAVGVGATGTFGSVNTLEGMATGCGTGATDGGAPSGSGGVCGGYFAFNTYADLKNDVNQVTGAVESLAHSIYFANYCSPKRGSAMVTQHTVTFSVVGNSASEVSATCNQATFTGNAPATCAQGGSVDTEVCQQSGPNVTCCPPDQPFWCPPSPGYPNGQCFPTAADAQAGLPNYPGCNTSCVQCGGTGVVSKGNGTDLQPGPAIHVTFTPTGYTTNQCPYFWGPSCKALNGCCPTLDPTAHVIPNQPSSTTYVANCVADLTSAVSQTLSSSAETACMMDIAKYCPPAPTTNCANMQTCCQGYSAGPAQDMCYSALYAAYAGASADATCGAQVAKFCPNSGTSPQCAMLKTCCTGLGVGGQQSCVTDVTNNVPSNDAACTPFITQLCPTTTNCKAFAMCCANFGLQYGGNCYSQLTAIDGTDTNCAPTGPYMTQIKQYCPTTPNCQKLLQCCANKPETCPTNTNCVTRGSCDAQVVNSANTDATCGNALSTEGC
jgi:hypothetical protein